MIIFNKGKVMNTPDDIIDAVTKPLIPISDDEFNEILKRISDPKEDEIDVSSYGYDPETMGDVLERVQENNKKKVWKYALVGVGILTAGILIGSQKHKLKKNQHIVQWNHKHHNWDLIE